MGKFIGKQCQKCGRDNWLCIDNKDCYYEICCSCSTETKYRKDKLVDEFECPECGGLAGHAEENKYKFGIRCDNCGQLFVKFEKAEGSVDNRSVIQSRPSCPHCGSTNIAKISTTSRLISTSIFGLASSKIGKTMECKKCGYKW